MNLGDVQDLLLEASAFDGRTVTDETVTAWHRLLRDLDASQAMKAMRTHFENEDRRLMPVHVVQGVKKIRADLMGGYQGPGLSVGMPTGDPDNVMQYLREGLALRSRAGDGDDSNVLVLEQRIGRMPNYMASRETTAMVVPCKDADCKAIIGRQCRTKKGDTRAPHRERMDDFLAWKEGKDQYSA